MSLDYMKDFEEFLFQKNSSIQHDSLLGRAPSRMLSCCNRQIRCDIDNMPSAKEGEKHGKQVDVEEQ